jgi:hypothetical protein
MTNLDKAVAILVKELGWTPELAREMVLAQMKAQGKEVK